MSKWKFQKSVDVSVKMTSFYFRFSAHPFPGIQTSGRFISRDLVSSLKKNFFKFVNGASAKSGQTPFSRHVMVMWVGQNIRTSMLPSIEEMGAKLGERMGAFDPQQRHSTNWLFEQFMSSRWECLSVAKVFSVVSFWLRPEPIRVAEKKDMRGFRGLIHNTFVFLVTYDGPIRESFVHSKHFQHHVMQLSSLLK